MKLTFYGGARWVTGSNYLLDTSATKILIDCGLFQGRKYAEDLNYQPFKYNPKEVDCVLVTHSHIDHIGRLPKLFKEGFRGKVYTTSATRDLMAVSLPDNLKHIAGEAEHDGHPALFDAEDVVGLMSLVKGVEYEETINIGNLQVKFHDAGHILGSSIIEVNWDGKKIYFSGDLGNPPEPLLNPTEFVSGGDYLVIESAYGDRIHEQREERQAKLADIIRATAEKKGVLMIPSFAMERTQELLFELDQFLERKEIPQMPVFIDSPLAIRLTKVYEKHSDFLNKQAMGLIAGGNNIFTFPGLKLTESVEDSKAINNIPPPKIIIAGSGMSHGGRIIHHERRYLSDSNSTILFVGYQVDGSLGRHIQRGDKTVSIFGESVAVNCRVESISSYSAHADQPTLLHWAEMAKAGGKLKKVFVVQGEETSSKTLANLIREKLGVDAVSPMEGESFEL